MKELTLASMTDEQLYEIMKEVQNANSLLDSTRELISNTIGVALTPANFATHILNFGWYIAEEFKNRLIKAKTN